MNSDHLRQELLEFARRLTREVCVRAASHGPSCTEERRWKTEGPVRATDLDCVKSLTFLPQNGF